MIVSNQVQCLKCKRQIYSMHRHHFVWCDCKSIAVDGGQDYLRRVGNGPYKEMSIALPKELVEAVEAQVDDSIETGRNSYGIALGMFRALRDNGYKVVEDSEENL